MVNGFGVSHGGIVYSLADSALAFACNTHGKVTVAIENSISYPQPVSVGDVLTAVAEEESSTSKLGFYRVIIRNQKNAIVSTFRGTVYKTEREHADRSQPGVTTAESTRRLRQAPSRELRNE
jgi:acyl-CoA thioesterase